MGNIPPVIVSDSQRAHLSLCFNIQVFVFVGERHKFERPANFRRRNPLMLRTTRPTWQTNAALAPH